MDYQKLADVIVGGRVNMCFGAWRLSERSSGWHSACRRETDCQDNARRKKERKDTK